jgi:hypothetical protein
MTCEWKPFGNLLQNKFEDLWFSKDSKPIRLDLRKDCCPTCTLNCFPSPVNIIEVAEISINKNRNQFQQEIKP